MQPPVPAGSDFLNLDPSVAPAKGRTSWLVRELRSAVADGRLAPGTGLPATRLLAAELGVSRGVVVEAYQRLGDEGLVRARPGLGTVVVAGLAAPVRRPHPDRPMRAPGAVDRALPPTQWPAGAAIDLTPGVPDLSAFPRALWLRAERAVLASAGAGELHYGDPRGSLRLRTELAGWLARIRGVRASEDDVIVVAGVAQAMALLAQTLHRRGTTDIAVEDPGSRGARDELAHWGLRPVAVPVDDDGVRVDALIRTGVRAVMLTPAHQFPTGVVLAPQRRRDLLGWAAEDGLVIEDDYDAEHRYGRAPTPALQASAPDQVAHTGSTSKTLAPGLRLGWLVAPRHLQGDLATAKHASDLGCPALPQLVLAELIASGAYDRHIRLVRGRQRARRDAVLAALRRELPQVRVGGVAAGLHLVVSLPALGDAVDDVALADRAREAGVVVQPLSWHRMRPGPPGLVIGYAAHAPDRLSEAVRRLARVLRPAG